MADELNSKAWMLTSQGLVVRTGKAGREVLNGRAAARVPDDKQLEFGEGSLVRPQEAPLFLRIDLNSWRDPDMSAHTRKLMT